MWKSDYQVPGSGILTQIFYMYTQTPVLSYEIIITPHRSIIPNSLVMFYINASGRYHFIESHRNFAIVWISSTPCKSITDWTLFIISIVAYKYDNFMRTEIQMCWLVSVVLFSEVGVVWTLLVLMVTACGKLTDLLLFILFIVYSHVTIHSCIYSSIHSPISAICQPFFMTAAVEDLLYFLYLLFNRVLWN